MTICKYIFMGLMSAAAIVSDARAQSGGLSGPSSVAADLEPGDGLTDPQMRSDFPRNVAPGWFAWKDGLAESGFKFNFDYLALGQWSNMDVVEDSAAGGMFRFYGNWAATENGSLTFKLEHRHAYTDVAPQNLGFAAGATFMPGTAFNDNGTLLTNLFWTQRAPEGGWSFQAGQIDVTDFLDIYGAVSPYSAFQNLSFNTNPTINAPNPGLGLAGGVWLGDKVYAVGSVADANADPSDPGFDVFDHGKLFKSLEVGLTSARDRIYFDNVHLALWHIDGDANKARAEDYGASFSAAWFVDNKWLPFVRAGVADKGTGLYKRSLSTGLAYYGRNTDAAGLGLNWAESATSTQAQFTAELFYRFSISSGLQITPSIQVIDNPLDNSGLGTVTVLGLRTRLVF
ncbi:carbohydrate porin [Shimia sagamensis]|uniref:Porin n=1 Tax=Shimia sagamensis TaxID=1566352 RepID=A0ABY1P4K1_9RHOB|nr:carbohydrate porin [Shimia sagamensis]SMP24784.1 porin [Shimia sagamensis]